MRYRSGLPRYLQIAEVLRSRFHQAGGAGGGRVPSEHALCAEFKVSRPTVRQALDLLVHEGLLFRQPGRGTFTSPLRPLPRNLRVIGSVEDMLALGEETQFKLLDRVTARPPVPVARALRIEPAERVVRITGLRHCHGAPFQHATVYLPERIGRALRDGDLEKTSVIGAVERTLGLTVKYLEQAVEAALAPRAVARLLGAPRGSPLLYFKRTYFTEEGEPVEHALTYHVGRRYPYTVMLLRSERRG